MNILVLSFDLPATNSMPGSPRLFNLCRALSREHRLTLMAFSRTPERYQAFHDDPMSAGVFERVIVLPNPPAPEWWGTQVHRLRREVHFVTRYRHTAYHAEMSRRVREMFVSGGFDVFYVDTVLMTQYVMDSGLGSPAVVDLHDCLTLLFDRTMRMERNWVRKVGRYLTVRSMARVERSLSRAFNTVITNSPVDTAFLQSVAPQANVRTIGNGVDTEFFRAAGQAGDPRRLIFTGVMDYGPNEDAALHFAENILPLVQQRRPDAEFWVVGKNPTERVQRLSTRPGVHVTGGVPDVRPYLEQAGIFVCPLRYGTGVKNKLLAALAMRKPAVATRRSLEGLELRADEHVLVADEPADFAAQTVRLMDDADLARRLAESGRSFVERRYSWDSSAKELEGVLERAVRQGRARASEPATQGT